MRYLPAYGPDLNPIEQAFAKLKAALRKAAARTFDTLGEAIADALDTFTPLTRKLLVALWRYVKDGVIPEGAKMKTA